MPALSKAKKHLSNLILEAWLRYNRVGYALYWQVANLALGLYLDKATLCEMQELAEDLENRLGVCVFRRQEEKGP